MTMTAATTVPPPTTKRKVMASTTTTSAVTKAPPAAKRMAAGTAKVTPCKSAMTTTSSTSVANTTGTHASSAESRHSALINFPKFPQCRRTKYESVLYMCQRRIRCVTAKCTPLSAAKMARGTRARQDVNILKNGRGDQY